MSSENLLPFPPGLEPPSADSTTMLGNVTGNGPEKSGDLEDKSLSIAVSNIAFENNSSEDGSNEASSVMSVLRQSSGSDSSKSPRPQFAAFNTSGANSPVYESRKPNESLGLCPPPGIEVNWSHLRDVPPGINANDINLGTIEQVNRWHPYGTPLVVQPPESFNDASTPTKLDAARDVSVETQSQVDLAAYVELSRKTRALLEQQESLLLDIGRNVLTSEYDVMRSFYDKCKRQTRYLRSYKAASDQLKNVLAASDYINRERDSGSTVCFSQATSVEAFVGSELSSEVGSRAASSSPSEVSPENECAGRLDGDEEIKKIENVERQNSNNKGPEEIGNNVLEKDAEAASGISSGSGSSKNLVETPILVKTNTAPSASASASSKSSRPKTQNGSASDDQIAPIRKTGEPVVSHKNLHAPSSSYQTGAQGLGVMRSPETVEKKKPTGEVPKKAGKGGKDVNAANKRKIIGSVMGMPWGSQGWFSLMNKTRCQANPANMSGKPADTSRDSAKTSVQTIGVNTTLAIGSTVTTDNNEPEKKKLEETGRTGSNKRTPTRAVLSDREASPEPTRPRFTYVPKGLSSSAANPHPIKQSLPTITTEFNKENNEPSEKAPKQDGKTSPLSGSAVDSEKHETEKKSAVPTIGSAAITCTDDLKNEEPKENVRAGSNETNPSRAVSSDRAASLKPSRPRFTYVPKGLSSTSSCLYTSTVTPETTDADNSEHKVKNTGQKEKQVIEKPKKPTDVLREKKEAMKQKLREYKEKLFDRRGVFRKNQKKLAEEDKFEYFRRLNELTLFDRAVVNSFSGVFVRTKQSYETATKFAERRIDAHRALNDSHGALQWEVIRNNVDGELVEDLLYVDLLWTTYQTPEHEQLRMDRLLLSVIFEDNETAVFETRLEDITSNNKLIDVDALKAYIKRREEWIEGKHSDDADAFDKLPEFETHLCHKQSQVEGYEPIRAAQFWKSLVKDLLVHRHRTFRDCARLAHFLSGFPSRVIGHDLGCVFALIHEFKDEMGKTARSATVDFCATYLKNAFGDPV